ncbi:MAG: histidine kinase [Methylococcaceae bacterium]|nr:histidine kinase [Methylococcaceae bacterium]
MSLRFRLNLMISLAMLMIVGAGALFVVHNARRSVLEEVRSSVNMALQLVDAGLAHSRGREEPLMAWLAELVHMEKTRHLHIQLQQNPQSLIRLSQAEPRERSERAPSWFAWAVTPELTVGEKRVERSDGSVIRILIEANPEDEITEAWNEARGFLFLMIALAVSVYLLVHFTLGRAFKSVDHILHAMEDIEHGDYGKRLPRFALPEFDKISDAFNHMAQTLAKARGENRALTRQSLKLQEEERRYLAQELHDELGQSLSAIKLLAATLRNGAESEAANAIMEVCDHLFGVVRSMMRRLRPLMLDELGLIPSLEDLIAHWRNRCPNINIRFIHAEGVEESAGGAKIHLFRIVQECLTNIAKHADARNVWIELELTKENRIRLNIVDDGCGFDACQMSTGFGLPGMRERVASMEGGWRLETARGRGVELEIQIPCELKVT